MIDHSINELRNELLNMIKDLKEQLDKKDFEEDMLAY
jgi:predicted HTH domain antitoxin